MEGWQFKVDPELQFVGKILMAIFYLLSEFLIGNLVRKIRRRYIFSNFNFMLDMGFEPSNKPLLDNGNSKPIAQANFKMLFNVYNNNSLTSIWYVFFCYTLIQECAPIIHSHRHSIYMFGSRQRSFSINKLSLRSYGFRTIALASF